ncbi:MAG: CAP domain-containing protein [Hyphomonas sp.]
MLQYRYSALSLLALALAVPGVALSQPGVSGKLSPQESSWTQTSPEGAALQSELFSRAEAERRAARLGGLQLHDALARVATRHAIDMAERGYAADVTPEGLSLLDQIRKTDRQTLYSAFGANIAIVEAGAEADALHRLLMSDKANAANLLRPGFGHMGIGAVEKDGRLYLVQLMARVEGELIQPLPVNARPADSLKATYASSMMAPVSWSISDAEGVTLLRGAGQTLRQTSGRPVEGYLNLDVSVGPDIYSLRGPFVRVD